MDIQQLSRPRPATRRRAFAWIACFAVLFGGLALPMTPTLPRSDAGHVPAVTACQNCMAQTSILILHVRPERTTVAVIQQRLRSQVPRV